MKNIKYQIVLVFVFLLHSAQAQPVFESDDVQDAPAAPIDNYLLLAIGFAILMAYQTIKRKSKRTITQS